ncbi:hypothetical protein AWN76_010810 [Rhodothermaceae bacterium RA]|nr:hypothetical protein AWN76_010810 [Rhodothermaceae bacterium RA]
MGPYRNQIFTDGTPGTMNGTGCARSTLPPFDEFGISRATFLHHGGIQQRRSHPPIPMPHTRYILLLGLIVLLSARPAAAQNATLSGFVTDATDGQALELVNVLVQGPDGEIRGAVTNRDGLYLIPRLPAGRHVLRATYIGYETYVDTLVLAEGERRTVNIALAPSEEQLGEVVVQTERTSGAARITAGLQSVRPDEIELVPMPDVAGDLANYLTTLPGVVSTGDRGGQLFIRGGEPSQNLVQLDGMILYQPFHVLGFYSAFPSDILSRADVYAGGFGSPFGNRIASVIDVWTREGNRQRWAGAASVSPFISTLQLEGPLGTERASVLLSARQSLIEQGAARYLDAELPYRFHDAFGKLHLVPSARSRLSITGLHTYDRGTLGETTDGAPAEELRWSNTGLGVRYLILPRILPIAAEVRVTRSSLHAEQGPPDEPTRSTAVTNTKVLVQASYFGNHLSSEAGLEVSTINTESNLGGLFQNTEASGSALNHFALFFAPEWHIGGLRIQPGARAHFYSLSIDPYLEPRLRLVWEQGLHQISAAAGIYHQEILGLSDRRDAASVFTAWTNVPTSSRREDVLAGRLPGARHAILGYRLTPTPWLEVSVEGFGKWLDNLFIAEWSAFPRFTTRLQPAQGRTYGFDVRAEVRRGAIHGYLTYGYSSTRYVAKQASLALWYGEETLRFRPPHDRRHQLNVLLSGDLRGFSWNTRWEFGSGLPFSRAYGFDGFVLIDDVVDVSRTPRSRRVIYERPFNGVLPTYHRLDLSVARTVTLRRLELTVQATAINVYDRRNLFYLDVFTLERSDQLPFTPSLGLHLAF